jgi:hypothetical protein
MSDFLRPEARALLLRWREALIGGAAAALGLWLLLTAGGLLFLFGIALALGGGWLAVAGVQRGRFRQGGEGPGVVRVVEGSVTYFGPWGGGVAAFDRLAWLELVPAPGAAGLWVLIDEEGQRLEIPVDARGAEALLDVFAALPGLRTGAMLRSLQSPVRERTLIWQRDSLRLH